jgi:hypothetical protein
MTTCPRCRREHKGPRDLSDLFVELARALARAREMPMAAVKEYLRTQALGLGLELSDLCTDCTLVEIAASMVRLEIASRPEPEPLPDNVIPMFPRRDLLDVGATFDSTRKP